MYNRRSTQNYFAEWSMIYLPYTTGDVHIGNNKAADVPFGGPQDQQMVGAQNFEVLLQDLKTFYGEDRLDEIFITGSSAGGFGCYFNCMSILDAFPKAQSTVLIDAAPIFFSSPENGNQCLINQWERLFQFHYPSDYDQYIKGNYSMRHEGIYDYLAHKYPNTQFGLFSHLQDQVIAYFYGFSANDCDAHTQPISGEKYQKSLEQVATVFEESLPSWKVYYMPGTNHTILGNLDYNQIEVRGHKFGDWVEKLSQGKAENVMP